MEVVTARESEAAQRRMAGALLAHGVRSGDRVAVVSEASSRLLALLLGAVRRGIVPVVLNPDLLPGEQQALISDADPRLVVRDADLATLADGPVVELAPAPLARPMHYTSGTTGRPKGVWSGVLDEPSARAVIAEEQALWQFAPDDIHLVCSPLHHSAPVRFAAGTLLAGGTVVLVGRFDPRRAAAAINRYRPTTAFMAPAHLQRLLRLGEQQLPALSSFRLVAHAGSACPEPLKRAALAAFPVGTVWEFYGSTEGQFTACSPDEWLQRPGTVGRARPGRRVSIGVNRAIWCEVPAHARFAYWRDPEKTASAWDGPSFTVGDIGRLDDDGYVFIDGRRDDLVITGGMNVYPAEVEGVLHTMPGIRDAVVFGVLDDRWGQQVCAAVVGDTTAEDVIAFSRTHLAAYKCPKHVVMIPQIPIGPTGKVRRAGLAAFLGLESAAD